MLLNSNKFYENEIKNAVELKKCCLHKNVKYFKIFKSFNSNII